MPEKYIEPTQAAAQAFFTQNQEGEVVMLNLLRFREVADYTDFPELAPEAPISGREAYDRYMKHAFPFLKEQGGRMEFLGTGDFPLIGPAEERWDLMMLVRQRSRKDFMAFATNQGYLAGLGHRTAALEDSRLIPFTEVRK